MVKEDANQSWHSLISHSSSVGSALVSCKDFCKCNNYFVARVAGNMRDRGENQTFQVDKATMDAGTALQIKVLEVDKMCKIAHAISCNQVAASKTQ